MSERPFFLRTRALSLEGSWQYHGFAKRGNRDTVAENAARSHAWYQMEVQTRDPGGDWKPYQVSIRDTEVKS